ncbi:MAG TPA: ABC transporter permease [Byssovorax sp.]
MNGSRFWTSLRAVVRKEFIHVRRDRSALFIALFIPIMQFTLFGSVDQTVSLVPTVVVDQDRTRVSRELVDKLRATKTFAVDHVTESTAEARDLIAAGRDRVGVVVPPDFHDRRTRGGGANLLVLIDGSDSAVSAQALAAINGLVAQENVTATLAKTQLGSVKSVEPLAAHPVILFNPEGRTPNYIIPGLIAIIMNLVCVVQTAIAIVRERERGTLEQLLVSPIDPLGLMLGKVAPYLLIGLGEAALVLLAMRFGFSIPIRGSLVFLFAMMLVYLFALLSLGLYISTVARTQQQAQQMAQGMLLPSIFLSGYIFPTSGLPLPLYWLGQCFPVTHMIAILRGIVLRDAGPLDLWPNVLVLVCMSLALMALTVRRFRTTSLA